MRGLVIVERPKEWQPAVLVACPLRGQVGRVDNKHRVKLKANRPGLDAAYASQHDGAEQLLVAGAAANALAGHLEQPFTRRVFNEPDQGLDVVADPCHGPGGILHVIGRQSGKLTKKTKFGGTGQGRAFENVTPAGSREHAGPLSEAHKG